VSLEYDELFRSRGGYVSLNNRRKHVLETDITTSRGRVVIPLRHVIDHIGICVAAGIEVIVFPNCLYVLGLLHCLLDIYG
jgi:hypothetical protein